MSFAQVLERLRDASRMQPEDDRCVYGQRRIVSREDLAELVHMFDSIDQARRQCIADLERYHSALHDLARLRVAIESVEEGLSATRKLLDPASKAELIAAAFELVRDEAEEPGHGG